MGSGRWPQGASTINGGVVPALTGSITSFLRADGTWATPVGVGGGSTTLATLTDVTITSPAAGQTLTYSGSTWANTTPATVLSPFLLMGA